MARESKPPPDDDRETLTLQEIEPSPVDETPADAMKDDYFPSSSSPPPAQHSSTLGLSGHGSIYWRTFSSFPSMSPDFPATADYLSHKSFPNTLTNLFKTVTRIQKYATYPLAAYMTAHITNTSLIPLITRSVPASEPYLLLTRPYYQTPLAEDLLIIFPLWAHVLSGLALRFVRRQHMLSRFGAETSEDSRKVGWPHVSGISALGLTLLPLAAGHILVNRVTPLLYGNGSSDVGLGFVSHGFAKHPWVANCGYAFYIAVAASHFVWGGSKWLGLLPENVGVGWDNYSREKWQRTRRWVINGVAATVAALWMAGGLGVVGRGGLGRGWEAKVWDELYRSVPVIGRWMD